MLGLDEWLAALKRDTVKQNKVVQCKYGADYVKPTVLVGNIVLADVCQVCDTL